MHSRHKAGITEHQVERAILVYAADVNWSWTVFIQEAIYNFFGHLAAGFIWMRHGTTGLQNRGFDCNCFGSGHIVVIMQAAILLLSILSLTCFVAGRVLHGFDFEVSESEVMLALSLNICRCLTIATKYGFMPKPVYKGLDKRIMSVESRSEYLLLGGWWAPRKELLYREMEKASARHDPEFDTRLVVFETKEAKQAALDAMRYSLNFFIKMESGRLAPDIEQELRYNNAAWQLKCQRSKAYRQQQQQQQYQYQQRQQQQGDDYIEMLDRARTPSPQGEDEHEQAPQEEEPAEMQGPLAGLALLAKDMGPSAVEWMRAIRGRRAQEQAAAAAGETGGARGQVQAQAQRTGAGRTTHNPLQQAAGGGSYPAAQQKEKDTPLAGFKPTSPALVVAEAQGKRARARVAHQQRAADSTLCQLLDNTETGRDIWKKAMAARHAIPAKLFAWHTVGKCYMEEPAAWMSILAKVVALIFAALPIAVRMGLDIPPFGTTPLSGVTIVTTMMLSGFCAHTTALYCCVGALDASRRLQVQLAMSELIDLKRDGVADARMMVQSVQADIDCERRQAAAAKAGESSCGPAGDRRRSSGPGLDRRSTLDLSTELQRKVLEKSIAHTRQQGGATGPSVLQAAALGTAGQDRASSERDAAVAGPESDLEGSLHTMSSMPRSRRRLSVLHDVAPGIEVDSDEDDSDDDSRGLAAGTRASSAHRGRSNRDSRRARAETTGLSNALLRVGGRYMAPPARSELLESGAQLSQSAAARFVRDELRTLRLPLLRPGNVEAWFYVRRVCLDTGRLYERRITANGGLYLAFALANLVAVFVMVFTEAGVVVRLAETGNVFDLPRRDRVLLARFGILVLSCLLLELLFSLTIIAQVVLGAMSNEEGTIHCDRIVQAEAVVTELRFSPPTVLMLLAAQLAKNSVDRVALRLGAVADACNVAARRIRSELDVEPMRILGLPASFALVSTIVSAAGSGVVAAASAISDTVSQQA